MLSIEEIIRATGGRLTGNGNGVVSGVSTDSRSVSAGQLFVALKGERFDGHDFIDTALANGVTTFVVADDQAPEKTAAPNAQFIVVSDTIKALGDIAAFYRQKFAITVVGITGSNGKTTTKEMLATILSQTGPGLKTAGNLNNLIGLPLMLLRLSGRERWAVMEMGMSEPGEIDRLAEIAAPQIGIITNAFTAHLASMGSVEAVARAKGELFLRLKQGGTAIYNADDPLISRLSTAPGVTRLSFGLRGAEVSSEGIETRGIEGMHFTLRLPDGEVPVKMKAFGLHNVYNALAAAAAAHAMGLDRQTICTGLEEFTPYDKRFHVEQVEGLVLIDDSYNANPASMAAALVTLKDIRRQNRGIAVLGDMLELGSGAAAAHREVGLLAATCVERLYLMGEYAETVAAGAVDGGMGADSIHIAESHGEIVEDLRRKVAKGDNILIKGSRGMHMEKIAEAIRNGFSLPADNKGVA
ncbi:UDP-N-acetylmuramoyl-tripeptide--D-alanyl-D-alanine ligase [Geotalea sp. SG265]|uniref:UDP-N-acetylmuramoyl-tripeptide--D-alanyl-D- alanine ligase n=1 Tax=Geotalea sp. SG265 TaxID=2922867 RepID=UPI001FAE9C0E|nr:UDP-N-acetylmuramoyl-tripeptide--D-alanyl-D-alanine ligase [Geotalea sp. SG265]